MSILLTGDWHLTDSKKDEYRWGIFDWVKGQSKEHQISHLFILGDLVDKKEGHRSQFVNRVVDELADLLPIMEVYVLAGNHDGLFPGRPFFDFCKHIEFRGNKLHYISEPTFVDIPFSKTGYRVKHEKVALFPYDKNAAWEWREYDCSRARMIMTHATFDGAVVENGTIMEGLPHTVFKGRQKGVPIFAGDIHVPQKLGPVEHIGAPYPIRHGDTYTPRLVVLSDLACSIKMGDSGAYSEISYEIEDIHFLTISKHMLTISDEDDINNNLKLNEGDQIKIKLKLNKSERSEWDKRKRNIVQACKDRGLILNGIEFEPAEDQKASIRNFSSGETPTETFKRFTKNNKIDKFTAKIGKEFLDAD